MLNMFNPSAMKDKYLVVIKGWAVRFFLPTFPWYPKGITIFFSGNLSDTIANISPGIERNKLKIPVIAITKESIPRIYAAINFFIFSF